MSSNPWMRQPRRHEGRGAYQHSRCYTHLSRSPRRAGSATYNRNSPGGGAGIMPRLPVLSGREVVRAFECFDWRVARQSGSHIVLIKEGHIASLSVPDHREVARGTLSKLIRVADLTVAEFINAANS